MALSPTCLLLILGLLRLSGAYDIQHSLALYNATTVPSDLVAVIESEINGNWDRSPIILKWAAEAQTQELREAIYGALWEQLWQMKQIDNPSNILDLYDQLSWLSDVPLDDQAKKRELKDNIFNALWNATEKSEPSIVLNLYDKLKWRSDVPHSLMQLINQTFIGRCALLLEAQLYTDRPGATFPLLNSKVLAVASPNDLKTILQVLFDAVLTLESPLSVVKRLDNFSNDLTLLTHANIELFERVIDVGTADPAVLQALQSSLRSLLEKPNFEKNVDGPLRGQVYARLSKEEQLLYTAQKVCIRNMTDRNVYLHECPRTLLMCNNDQRTARAPFSVQRLLTNDSRPQFAFYSDYWRRSLYLDKTIQIANNGSATKNVYSMHTFSWWRVVYGNGGISLFDADTEDSVLCGGDPSQKVDVERQVYTRRAAQFKAHQWECTWSLEDCSYI